MGGNGSGANREAERLKKISWILALVSKKIVDKKTCLALVQMKWGTSRRTALEYLTVLIDSKAIEEVEGLLQVKK